MKKTILLLFALTTLSVSFAQSPSHKKGFKSDWEQTIGFIQEQSSTYFQVDSFDISDNDRLSFTAYQYLNQEHVRCKVTYVADLQKLEKVKKSKKSRIELDFTGPAVAMHYDCPAKPSNVKITRKDDNLSLPGTADNKMPRRLYRAFQHLTKLALKKEQRNERLHELFLNTHKPIK
ncbi:MAG: hypothetical protein JXR71_06815 [Bacteroidales bacterium]|nr:hypothetical protein [Bacteroidales bacterium]